MPTVIWQGTGNQNHPRGGAWETKTNWVGGALPTTGDSVSFGTGFSAYTVTASSATTISLADVGIASGVTLALNAANITSTNQITVTGGKLQANANSTLVANNLALSAGGELDVASTAKVSVSSAFTVASSTVNLAGATLTLGQGILLSGSNASLIGFGTVGGSNGKVTGKGTITSSGGNLTITGAVGNDAANVTGLIVGSGTTLALTTNYGIGVGTGSLLDPTVTFTNVSGQTDTLQAVVIGQGQLYLGAISNFGQGDFIDVQTFGSGDTVSLSGSTVKISAAGGGSSQTYTFSAVGSLTGAQIAAEVVASSSITGVSGGAIRTTTVGTTTADQLSICFMAGTMIRTPEGEAPIETLKRGDLVLTADGEAKPVVWLGRQTIVSRFADPVRNLPIRIAAGALADNVPSRDLLVSPEHALLVEGVLVHAGALVNGTSVRRESQVPDSFVYYHVELEDHSLVLAENVPAETFVDNVDRRNFDNWAEHEALYPEGRAVAELPLQRAKALRQVPLSIRAALAERAAALGMSEAA